MRGSTSAEARMRLVRFSTAGGPPRLGAVLGRWDHWEKIVDLSAVDSAIPADTLAFIDACPGLTGDVWERALRVLAEAEKIESDAPLWAFRPGDVRIHSPIAPRLLRDFLAFRAHVARTRAAAWAQIPPEWDALPAYYNGNPLNVVGTKEAIPPMRFETFEGRTPRLVPSAKMDYEAEIGFVLGQGGRDIDAAQANTHLFGVTIFNDFSARDLQATASRTGMGTAPGKDWANALGPCIVTRDDFGELRDQSIVVRVNNEERLRDRYRALVHDNPWVREGQRALWSFPEMLEFLSRFQPIHAGEVWGSGTIPRLRVGAGRPSSLPETGRSHRDRDRGNRGPRELDCARVRLPPEFPCEAVPRKGYRPTFRFSAGERMAALPAFLKLKVDHKTVLCRDVNTYRALRDFLLNSGYSPVYETERVGEEKTAMATFACLNPLTGERLAVVLGMSAPNEVSHAQVPFAYGFAGKPQKDAHTYMQHLALRTTDIEKLKSYLESKGAEFLTPIYKDKDSFGPLLQSFTRELFDDEWFFIEFVQRDYDADKVGAGGTQFVQNTVKSLYVSKQEELREWEKTGKKRKFLDGVPEKERTNLLRDILMNTEPKGYVETVAPITRHVKLT